VVEVFEPKIVVSRVTRIGFLGGFGFDSAVFEHRFDNEIRVLQRAKSAVA
jgi:hypothetical protein